MSKPTLWVSDLEGQKPASAVTECNFGFKKKRYCPVCVAITKVLISCAVTVQMICAFVFAKTFCWFSYAVAHNKVVQDGSVVTSFRVVFLFCLLLRFAH